MSTVTYTGTTGAGQALTASVFNDVTDVDFNLANNTLNITYGTPSKIAHLDLSAVTTVTYTISGGVATITVS